MKRAIVLLLLIFCLALPAFAQECEGQCQGPPSSPSPNPGPSDPGPGTGGHIMLDGDMELLLTKELSLDGWRFYDAAEYDDAFVIPEERDSKVYFRVTVKNVSDLTAVGIRISQDFDEAQTDMIAEELIFAHNRVGYDPQTREFRIDELKVGESITFTYSILIHELGQSDERATETLTITDYNNKLPIYNNGLKFLSKGQADIDFLVAGILGSVKGVSTAPGSPSDVPDFSTPPTTLAATGTPSGFIVALGALSLLAAGLRRRFSL